MSWVALMADIVPIRVRNIIQRLILGLLSVTCRNTEHTLELQKLMGKFMSWEVREGGMKSCSVSFHKFVESEMSNTGKQ